MTRMMDSGGRYGPKDKVRSAEPEGLKLGDSIRCRPSAYIFGGKAYSMRAKYCLDVLHTCGRMALTADIGRGKRKEDNIGKVLTIGKRKWKRKIEKRETAVDEGGCPVPKLWLWGDTW